MFRWLLRLCRLCPHLTMLYRRDVNGDLWFVCDSCHYAQRAITRSHPEQLRQERLLRRAARTTSQT
jgi:hypothetical protein